jgi:predicted dehydrogenase
MAAAYDPSRRQFLGTAGVLGASLLAGTSRAADETPLAPPDKQPPELAVPELPEKRVGWAIVGLGELALGEIMPAFGLCKLSRPTALVSGHRDKAEKVAEVYGIKKENVYNYDNYDKMADNPDIDVVYIVLPNSMHAEFTNRALKAKKHVLCEKPMAGTVKEAEEMIATAEKVERKLMIAYRLHYEPLNLAVMDMCQRQEFGKIQTITSSHCQQVKAPNIRLSKKLAGGPLGDIGVYSINATRYITRQEPTHVTAFVQNVKDDPRFREVPAGYGFALHFPGDVVAVCDCSFNAAESRRYRVHCTDGYIDMDPAFSYRGLQLHVFDGKRKSQLNIPQKNHFAGEMEHFSDCVLRGKTPRTPGEEGLADMRIIRAIEEAAESGQAVKVA